MSSQLRDKFPQLGGSERRCGLVLSLTGALENGCPVATEIGSASHLKTVRGWVDLAPGLLPQLQTAEGSSMRTLVLGGVLTHLMGPFLKWGDRQPQSVLTGIQVNDGVNTSGTDNTPIGTQDMVFVIKLNPHNTPKEAQVRN